MDRVRLNPAVHRVIPDDPDSPSTVLYLTYFRDGRMLDAGWTSKPLVCASLHDAIKDAEIGRLELSGPLEIDGEAGPICSVDFAGFFVIPAFDDFAPGYAAVHGATVELLPDGPSNYGIAPSLN